MCGITAIVSPRGVAPGTIDRMIASIRHRGPDASASEQRGDCALGHARLAIIDLTTGAQPMADVTERYWISFNGEIYNYPELREQLLALGHQFHTHSDTEVVIAAWLEWGSAFLDRLRGMYAFALWDSVERSLFCARDLFGEKPLYYATAGETLVLSSELKAIIASGAVSLTVDPESIDAYLTLGYIPPDRTVYREVETLPPGHFLTWKDGKVQVTRYWTPRFETRQISLNDAAEQLRVLLARAVKRQTIADVPVGAFLSGGLDSSTVVALMKETATGPLKTFSVGFGKYINELPYARAVAERYETEHHEIDLGEPDVATLIQRMVSVYDEPFADTSNIPTYLVSEFAQRYVKVVLSGDGGDELFGGYYWYSPIARAEGMSMAMLQWLVLRGATKLLPHPRAMALRAHAAGLAARWPDAWSQAIASNTIIRAPERRRLWGPRDVASFEPGGYYRPAENDRGLNRAFQFDLTSYLPGDILVKVDRAAMAHGLETRAPFLDRDVVEFSLSLPANLKVKDGETKIVLKEACSRYWPESLRNRKKQGFGAPIDRWVEQPRMKELLDRVFARDSRLRTLLPGIGDGEGRGRDYRTWTLFTLGLWLEAHEVSL